MDIDKIKDLNYNENMEEKIYNDYIPTKEDILKNYKSALKDEDQREDMIYDGLVIEYFGLFFNDLYKIFASEKYAPNTLNDANNYLIHNVYKIDSVKEITGKYYKKVDGEKTQFTAKINKNNFYNAYYLPIWENLDLKERAQIVKWHFDQKLALFQIKDLELRFVPSEDYLLTGITQGVFGGNYLYIQNSLLKYQNPFELITTIEHEFEHVNQDYSYKYFKKQNKKIHNLYEKLILEDVNALTDKSCAYITKEEENALYFGYIMEQKAENRALKEYEKINRANKEIFGICNRQEKSTQKAIWEFKFRNTMLTVDEVIASNKYDKLQIEKYALDKKIKENSDYLSKIRLMMILTKRKSFKLELEEKSIKTSVPTSEQLERLKEIKRQKKKNARLINGLSHNFIQVLREDGEYLSDKFFKELEMEK